MEASPSIQIHPALEQEIRETTVPATGCVSGYLCPPKAENPDRAYPPDSNGGDADQRAAVGWIAYVHQGRRVAKLIAEPYPPGFPGEIAVENAERMEETLLRYLLDGAGRKIAHQVVETFCQEAKTCKKVAERGLHTVRPKDLRSLMESVRSAGMPTGAAATMMRDLTRGDLHIGLHMDQQDMREWSRSASVKQAKAALQAARHQGMDQYGICNLAQAMGYHPQELGEDTPRAEQGDVERLLRRALSIGIPEEAALSMAASLDWKRGQKWRC